MKQERQGVSKHHGLCRNPCFDTHASSVYLKYMRTRDSDWRLEAILLTNCLLEAGSETLVMRRGQNKPTCLAQAPMTKLTYWRPMMSGKRRVLRMRYR